MPNAPAIIQYVEEALKNPLFSQLWEREKRQDIPPLHLRRIRVCRSLSGLSSNKRAALYNEIATVKRASLLDGLSGLKGWKHRLRLLPKTHYRLFDETDWRALFQACEDPTTRRALGHLTEVTPTLVRQLRLVPRFARLPSVLAVLNQLRVTATHQRNNYQSAGRNSARTIAASGHDGQGRCTANGSFWDFFFECTDQHWRPFDLPERFLASPLLRPLRTTKDLETEGLKMKNCLAGQVANVRAGRMVYFSWQGSQPATVQFVRGKGWRLGIWG